MAGQFLGLSRHGRRDPRAVLARSAGNQQNTRGYVCAALSIICEARGIWAFLGLRAMHDVFPGAFFIFIGGASLVAVSTFRTSTAQLGFYMGTITGGFVLGSFLCGRFSERHALTTM